MAILTVGANASHGLRRTNADKRKAVEMMLSLAEQDKIDGIKQWSQNEIAKQCGVSWDTVNRIWQALSSRFDKIESQEQVIVNRGNSSYVMNTANIGKPAVSPYAKPIDITKEAKAPPVVPEPTVYHWEQPESEPVDPEVITFEDEDIVMQKKNTVYFRKICYLFVVSSDI